MILSDCDSHSLSDTAMSGNNLVATGIGLFSKTLVVSGAVVFGAGLGIVLYQQHRLCRDQEELVCEVRRLTETVARLEAELKKTTMVPSSSFEEIDEIFMDASESDPQTLKSDTEQISRDEGLNGLSNVKEVFAQVDRQMLEGSPANLIAANETLKLMTRSGCRNANVYWRLAKSFFLLASDDLLDNPNNDGSAQQKDLMKKAFEAAELAIELDSQCGDAYKWLAIIRGSITQYLPIQEQIKSAYDIKDNIVASIKFNPDDSLSHHMLGRWCFSVYSLGWFERRVAATLFASPPTSTLEEAMESFLKAEEISPKDSIDNCLYLAKCYISKKDYNKAVYWLQEGLKIEGSSRDVRICSYTDLKSIEEIKTLLNQYRSYASA